MRKFTATLLLILAGASLSWGQMYVQENLQFKSPKVPQYVVFAGDTVRFNRSDLY